MDKLTCAKCGLDKPRSNYRLRGGGNRKLVSGEINQHEYRHLICRKCFRQSQIANGLCICNQPLAAGHNSCQRCLDAVRISTQARAQIDRIAALDHYGGSCAFCGETLYVFLSIDHINNNGCQHRKTMCNGSNNSINIGAWLRRNKYPAGFQVLCMNCNHAKGRVGEVELIEILRNLGRLRSDFRERTPVAFTPFSEYGTEYYRKLAIQTQGTKCENSPS